MIRKTIPWTSGNGDITLTYNGQGNGTIMVDSDENTLFSIRNKNINVISGNIIRQVTVNQNACLYRLIEWVRNTQSNTLNFTGIIPNDDNWEFYGKVEPIFTGNYETVIRAYTGEQNNCYRIIRANNSNINVLVNANSKAGGGSTTVQNVVIPNIPLEFYLRKGAVTINGVTTALSTTQGNALTTALQINRGKWYALTIYHNNTIVKCYHPCVDSTGKYGFVDVLTDTIIYPTKGTFDSGGNYTTRNFKDVDRKRIVTRDGYFFNVADS